MYRRISGDPPQFRTGMKSSVAHNALRAGFDRLEAESLDAPDSIPAGGVYCVEWYSSLQYGERCWFPSQIITLRGYQ